MGSENLFVATGDVRKSENLEIMLMHDEKSTNPLVAKDLMPRDVMPSEALDGTWTVGHACAVPCAQPTLCLLGSSFLRLKVLVCGFGSLVLGFLAPRDLEVGTIKNQKIQGSEHLGMLKSMNMEIQESEKLESSKKDT